MRQLVRWIAFSWLILQGTLVAGQSLYTDSLFVRPDSSAAFTIENYYSLILKYHPIIRQTNLLSDLARQEIRLARGQFDPKLEATWVKKDFKETEYFNLFNAELKFPFRFPLDPKIGMYRNTGKYLNPEELIPESDNYRQYYAGVGIPLGRGLLTDERRTVLRQAGLFQDLTEAEQIKLINKSLLDAAKVYWSWYYSYYNYQILNRGVLVARDLFDRAKVNLESGELAPVDTLQASIILQQREVDKQEAYLEFLNAGISLSAYLWDSTGPVTLDTKWIPVPERREIILSSGMLEELRNLAMKNHPELRKVRVKRDQLEADRRLATEFLKPKLDLSYTLINQPFGPSGMEFNSFSKDYKLGVDFSIPLFLRKERSKLAMTKLKLQQNDFDQQWLERTIMNEIDLAYNTLQNTTLVIQRQQSVVNSYEKILEAEFLNLENGESDLFKINIQFEKLLISRTKFLKLLAEYEKQKAQLYWAAGIRNLGI